jgi:hypothetical protein
MKTIQKSCVFDKKVKNCTPDMLRTNNMMLDSMVCLDCMEFLRKTIECCDCPVYQLKNISHRALENEAKNKKTVKRTR